jgi:hypothetical protein
MRDAISRTQVKRVISPAAGAADNTAQVGQIIDHQGYDDAAYVILTGAIADVDATFAVLLEEGDVSNLSDAAAVADADMVSQTLGTAPETAAGFQFDDDNEVRKLAYIGSKRYTRLTITPAANAGTWGIAACCVLNRRGGGTATVAQASA